MRSLPFLALPLLLAHAPFSYAAETVFVTVVENPTATRTLAQKAPVTASISSSSQTTFATSASLSSTRAQTEVVQATHHQSAQPAAASAGGGSYYDGQDGSAGTDTGSFSLSKGGLIAIIVVVVAVAVFGSM